MYMIRKKIKTQCTVIVLAALLAGIFISALCLFFQSEEEAPVTAKAAGAEVSIATISGTVKLYGTGTVTNTSGSNYLWIGKPTGYVATSFPTTSTQRTTYWGLGRTITGNGSNSISVTDGTYECKMSFKNFENGSWVEKHSAQATITIANLPTLYQGYAQEIYSSDYSGRTLKEIRYSRTTSSNYPTSAGTVTDIKNRWKEEGNYFFVVRNEYESKSYTFTIDKTAPVLSLHGVTDGGETNTSVSATWSTATGTVYSPISHVGDKLTVQYARNESGGYPTSVTTNYSAGTELKEDGYYLMRIRDNAGNSTSYRFFIDRNAPVVTPVQTYINTAFTLSAQDKFSGMAGWEYSLNDGDLQREDAESLTLGGTAAYNGTWKIRAFDRMGNASEWITVNHVYRETFGNSDKISNAYFTPAYYVVTLSQKNYAGSSGTYSFAEYEHAFDFAVAKEWACRVIKLEGEKSWNYVTAANENARQIYTDRAELDRVIEKYARKNIGEKKIIGKNGAFPNNPTDANGVTRADALTAQLTQLPPLLSSYSGLRFMLALQSGSLSAPQTIAEGNRSTATIKFLSDGISMREGEELSLRYGEALSLVAQEQGWYLVTERDVCGNSEEYLIYIDLQQPDLVAEVTYGNGSTGLITYNQAYVDENKDAMRYMEFSVQSLIDNIDPFSVVSIEGRNLDARYVNGEDVPLLSFENGYSGAYTIFVYDRSRNLLEFVVCIAGEAPALKHSSLTADTLCTFTVTLNDGNNEIKDIKLYKVHFNGGEERLYVDSFETEISAENLVYKIAVGGKYIFEFTDLYGRTVRTNPIFYMKGLPLATLRGVKDGEITKNDVSVTYDIGVTAELYIWANGEWVITDLYELTQGISGNVIKIAAGEETTATYKVLLYVTDDRNLFSEYTFEIDGIPPSVNIFAENGESLFPETVTNQNFYITWAESGYKAYYKKQGALSDTQYTKETLIKAAGTYVFIFYDEARNELSFTVTLDNSVSFTLDGSYTLLEDGSYITRGNYVLTVTEPFALFKVESTNGLTVANGQKIDENGTYRIQIEDMHANKLSLTLIIDRLPPVPVIKTESGRILSNGASTQEAFFVYSEEENVAITYSKGCVGYAVYNGSLLDEAGRYTFRLADFMGNVATVSVTVDRDLSYRIEGSYLFKDGAYHSRTWLQAVVLEETALFTVQTETGVFVDPAKRISEEGSYLIKIQDTAGNTTELIFIIDKTAPPIRIITESGTEYVGSVVTNQSFRIVCEEDGAKIKVGFQTSLIDYAGGWITESGKYTVRITDYLGNVAETEVIVNKNVSLTVNGTYVVHNGVYAAKSWLSVTLGEEMKAFYIKGQDGREYGADTRITAEGVYEVYAQDMQGNEITLWLEVDMTAPVIELSGLSGGGETNMSVTATFGDYTEAYYRMNGGDKINVQSGVVFEAEGTYLLTVRDKVGNTAVKSFTIDLHVDVTPNVPLSNGRIITGGVSFAFGEEVTAVLMQNGVENAYVRGEIAAAGEYVLTVTDGVGNVAVFSWTIVPKRAREYTFKLREGVSVSVEKDGELAQADLDGDLLRLTENGGYVLLFIDGNDRFELAIEIDHVAPTIDIENTGKSIKIFNPNKNGVTYKLYLNGAETSFRMQNGTELTEIGSYRLVCTDDVGNITEYVFELNYMSAASVALIAAVSVLAFVGLCVLLALRFKRNIF